MCFGKVIYMFKIDKLFKYVVYAANNESRTHINGSTNHCFAIKLYSYAKLPLDRIELSSIAYQATALPLSYRYSLDIYFNSYY